MSWDLFAMGTAVGEAASDVPSDWVLSPIASLEELLKVFLDIVPFAEVSDPRWVRIDSPGAA